MKKLRPPMQLGRRGGDDDKAFGMRLRDTVSTARNQAIRPLNEPLRRLQWLRQELDLWNARGGDRPMPQPTDFEIPLPNMKPSEVHFGRAT